MQLNLYNIYYFSSVEKRWQIEFKPWYIWQNYIHIISAAYVKGHLFQIMLARLMQ